MTQSQQYLVSMVERLPIEDLPSDAQRSTFGHILTRLSSAENINAELRRLYRVKGFSEAALGMLWVVDQTDRDSGRPEANGDEETFVFARVRRALSTVDGILKESFQYEEERFPPPAPDLFAQASIQVAEEQTYASPSLQERSADSDPFGFSARAAAVEPAAYSNQEFPSPPSLALDSETTDADAPEAALGRLLDRFLEAIQVGSEDRVPLMQSVLNQCGMIEARPDSANDVNECMTLLEEFLRFVDDQQFLDDVRVMNAISNFQDPYAQWVNADGADRASLMEQAIEVLKNAKAMFE
jgi:hypothetical protein